MTRNTRKHMGSSPEFVGKNTIMSLRVYIQSVEPVHALQFPNGHYQALAYRPGILSDSQF